MTGLRTPAQTTCETRTVRLVHVDSGLPHKTASPTAWAGTSGRSGGRVSFCLSKSAPLSWGSLVFPFVPSGRLVGVWSKTQAAETRRLRRSETRGNGSG